MRNYFEEITLEFNRIDTTRILDMYRTYSEPVSHKITVTLK
jgi:hypothetical protein